MNRRRFVVAAAIGATTAGSLVGCGPGPGARRRGTTSGPLKRMQWRLVSSFTRSLDTLFGSADQFAERVKELTGGNFEIKTYQGGEIVPPLEVLEAVGRGSAEIGHTASYYYIGKNPALAFDCTVPFGLTARQQNAWMYGGGGLELMRPIFADFNVVNLPGGNTGTQMGGWFRTPIEGLADLRGRKMRIPGLGGEVMSRLGVTAQVIPGGEVYVSLERGAIDAAEWVGPHDDVKLGLHEVAKHYYYPGWWEPGAQLSYYINRTQWEKLPPEYRSALEVAAAESNVTMLARYDAQNATALRTIRDADVTLSPFPRDVMEAARRESEALLEQSAAGDATYRKVYDAFTKFRREQFEWFSLGEQAYADFSFAAEKGSAGV